MPEHDAVMLKKQIPQRTIQLRRFGGNPGSQNLVVNVSATWSTS
jgi:hypothetical protein